MAALAERARPTSLDDVAGQSEAVDSVRRVLACGDGTAGGRAWFISGASGTGKTTLARILARTVAGEMAIEESNGADWGVDDVRTMERGFQCRALARDGEPTGKAWVVNEAHLIRGAVLSRLLTTLESDDNGLPAHVVLIFTTTAVGAARMFGDHDDASPLVSRCVELRLDNGPESRRDRALWVRQAAQAVGVDGYDESVYLAAMSECNGNTRMLAQRVESGQLAKSARGEMPAAKVKPAKVGKVPDVDAQKAMPLADLRRLCVEHGAASGWAATASQAAAMGYLAKKGGQS